MIPIKSDEFNYILEHSSENFIDRINESNVDVSSLDRKSVVLDLEGGYDENELTQLDEIIVRKFPE